MRPEKLDYLMENAFSEYFKNNNDVSPFYDLLPAMKRKYKKLVKLERNWATISLSRREIDMMLDSSSAKSEMWYIEDRWRSSSRLLWLICYIEYKKNN